MTDHEPHVEGDWIPVDVAAAMIFGHSSDPKLMRSRCAGVRSLCAHRPSKLRSKRHYGSRLLYKPSVLEYLVTRRPGGWRGADLRRGVPSRIVIAGEEWVPVRVAANIIGCSRSTVYRAIEAADKTGRREDGAWYVKLKDVQEWARERKGNGG